MTKVFYDGPDRRVGEVVSRLRILFLILQIGNQTTDFTLDLAITSINNKNDATEVAMIWSVTSNNGYEILNNRIWTCTLCY